MSDNAIKEERRAFVSKSQPNNPHLPKYIYTLAGTAQTRQQISIGGLSLKYMLFPKYIETHPQCRKQTIRALIAQCTINQLRRQRLK